MHTVFATPVTCSTALSPYRYLDAHTYLLTYSMEQSPFLRSWLVLQLIKKFPAFYGTRKSITVLTSARHLSLSWANTIQSPPPLPISWRSILILSSHLRLGLPNILMLIQYIIVKISLIQFRVFFYIQILRWILVCVYVYTRVGILILAVPR